MNLVVREVLLPSADSVGMVRSRSSARCDGLDETIVVGVMDSISPRHDGGMDIASDTRHRRGILREAQWVTNEILEARH